MSTDSKRGYIIPIGGAEKKSRKPVILKRVADLATQNGNGYLVVIPTASGMEDAGPRYVELFEGLGVRDAVSIAPEERADCERADYLRHVENASMIFFTGGNQMRLSTVLGGTSLAKLIKKQNANGVHVAGTSAGAAILSEHMIAGGEPGPTPTRQGVDLAAGLGLTNSLIIDQHFRQRDRLGRLLTAVFYSPSRTGIGIDENTAAFINPAGEFEVVGSGAITVVDPSNLQYSSTDSVRRGKPVSLIGLTVHILTSGARYDLNTHIATPAPKPQMFK